MEHIEDLAQRLEEQEDHIQKLEQSLNNLGNLIQTRVLPAVMKAPAPPQPPQKHTKKHAARLQVHPVAPSPVPKVQKQYTQSRVEPVMNEPVIEEESDDESDSDLDAEIQEELNELEDDEDEEEDSQVHLKKQ